MVIAVTARDWRPRYLQLAEDLRDQILSGELKPGSPVPSEPELAKSYDLSRTSVRGAIRLLRDWGLIRSEQGRGTFVRAPRQRVRRSSSERYQWEKDRVHLSDDERRQAGMAEYETGLTVSDLKFHAEYRTTEAARPIAEAFGVPLGTQLLERMYWTTSRDEDAPLYRIHSHLVYDMVAGNPALLDVGNEPWPGGTHHQLSTVGIEVDRITDEITARPPLPDEAETLVIEPGVSVLVIRKVSYDITGRVVEVADVVLPGDRTTLTYTTQLTRWSS